jgi:hypothetical protein
MTTEIFKCPECGRAIAYFDRIAKDVVVAEYGEFPGDFSERVTHGYRAQLVSGYARFGRRDAQAPTAYGFKADHESQPGPIIRLPVRVTCRCGFAMVLSGVPSLTRRVDGGAAIGVGDVTEIAAMNKQELADYLNGPWSGEPSLDDGPGFDDEMDEPR